jgi:hypothetical protein
MAVSHRNNLSFASHITVAFDDEAAMQRSIGL